MGDHGMTYTPVRTIKPEAGWVKPTVQVVENGGHRFLLKDYDACSGRAVFARYLAHREHRILKKLQGIEGIPGGVRLINGSKLIRDFVEGTFLKEGNPDELPDAFYFDLREVVEEMHCRDVVHLDLRHMKNIVVQDGGSPCLIDFETAVDLTGLSLVPALQELLKWVDRSALLRIKNRYFEHLMTEEDRQAIQRFYRWRRLWVFSPFHLREKDRVSGGNE